MLVLNVGCDATHSHDDEPVAIWPPARTGTSDFYVASADSTRHARGGL